MISNPANLAPTTSLPAFLLQGAKSRKINHFFPAELLSKKEPYVGTAGVFLCFSFISLLWSQKGDQKTFSH